MQLSSPFRSTIQRLVLSVIACAFAGLWAAPVAAREVSEVRRENERCFNCHARAEMATMDAATLASMVRKSETARGDKDGPRGGLVVSPESWGKTLHAETACTDCHRDAAQLPHSQHLQPASCNTGCHDHANTAFKHSIHAGASSGDVPRPSCADCHGGHDMKRAEDRRSKTHPLNVNQLCADCHKQHAGAASNGQSEAKFVDSYLDSVHGKAVTEAGLVVAANCVDCHGAHDVLPAENRKSHVNRLNISQTCGECHAGVSEVYNKSVHGQQLLAGSDDAPVCTDCHTAHAITNASAPSFKRDILNECGSCHDQPIGNSTRSLYETYRMSYHGQVTSLGSMRAARCSDCHGAHDIQRVDSPQSRLAGENRIETCRTCHPRAAAQFASFQPHADHRNATDYPVLHAVWLYFVIVISSTFAFFGLHTVLWFIRGLIEHRVHKHHSTAAKHHGRSVRRFSRIDRINHVFVIITFFGLTLTGMPLLFADEAWAKPLITVFGGVQVAGILHRIFGVMLIGNFVVHMGGVINRARKHGVRNVMFGPNSLMPKWRDVTDAVAMFRWFFGGKRPTFDHWTYWEKFDYWAEIFGTFVIGGTGLMLWFAAEASHIFPGWMFNVATIIHGYEALLAVGFIFTIHFFNAHLRPTKFPVDDVIFTGQLPEAEFAEERGDEYARLKATGELEALLTDPSPSWTRRVAVVVGVFAMLVGTGMVLLIVLAGLGAI